MANEVNKFFVQKIEDIKKVLGQHSSSDPLKALNKFLSQRTVPTEGFEMKDVTEEEMKKILRQMNGKKSCGLDWICGHSLKSVGEVLEPELRHMINQK